MKSILYLSLSVCLVAGPACALEPGDTMGHWKKASKEEKEKLVASLLKDGGPGAGIAKVIECLDAASAVPGHADLSIGKVAEACEADGGQPV